MGIAFTAGRVFVGNGQVIDNASVYVEDGRIVSVQEGEGSSLKERKKYP